MYNNIQREKGKTMQECKECEGCRMKEKAKMISLFCIIFNIKSGKCPCTNCIVKAMCNEKRAFCKDWNSWFNDAYESHMMDKR